MPPPAPLSFLARARTLWPAWLLLALGLATLAAAAIMTFGPREREAIAGIGGPFTLQSARGGVVSERDMLGAPYLIFFGFTHCPDVCPTALMQISEVLAAAGPAGRELKALFVSVDPAHDTPEVLRSYLASFDPRIIGLTGSESEIAAVVKAFKAYAKKAPLKGDDYTMDHSTLVYLIDKRGRFVGSLNLDRPPQAAAQEWLALR
jgi:protein SCO1/2